MEAPGLNTDPHIEFVPFGSVGLGNTWQKNYELPDKCVATHVIEGLRKKNGNKKDSVDFVKTFYCFIFLDDR